MPPSVAYQFAMGEHNGNPSYLVRSKKGLHGRNLPPALARLCQMPGMADAIVDFALGPDGRYFFTYKSARGIEFTASDGLWQFLKEEWKGSSVRRITFGPNDRFWGIKQWTEHGQSKQTTFASIPKSLTDKTKEIFPTVKTFNEVEVVSLGMNDSWVLVVDGVCYCSGIEKELMTAINAAYTAGRRLRNVVLSPLRAEVFWLEYEDNTIEFQLPGDWNHEQINLYASAPFALIGKGRPGSPSSSSDSSVYRYPRPTSPVLRPSSPGLPSSPRTITPRPLSPTPRPMSPSFMTPNRTTTLPLPLSIHRPTSPMRSMSVDSTFSIGTPPASPTRSQSGRSITHSVNRSNRSGSMTNSGYKNGVPILAYQFCMGENDGKPSYFLKSRRGMQWINLPEGLSELMQLDNMFGAMSDVALGPHGRYYFTYKSALGVELKTSPELWPFLNIPWPGARIDRVSFGGADYFWGLATFNDVETGKITQAPFGEVPDILASQAAEVWPDPQDFTRPRVDFIAVGMDDAWIMGIGRRCYWDNLEESIVKSILKAYAGGKTLRNAVLCPVRPDIYWLEFRDNTVESLLPPEWDIEGITAHLSSSNALTTPERSRLGMPSASVATANVESIESCPSGGWVEAADGSGNEWIGVRPLNIIPKKLGEDEDSGCIVM